MEIQLSEDYLNDSIKFEFDLSAGPTKEYLAKIGEMPQFELDKYYQELRQMYEQIEQRIKLVESENHGRRNGFCYWCEQDLDKCQCEIIRELAK